MELENLRFALKVFYPRQILFVFQVIKIQRLFRRFLAKKHARQLMLMHELSEDELSLEDVEENNKM
jgi:hypothetical protein